MLQSIGHTFASLWSGNLWLLHCAGYIKDLDGGQNLLYLVTQDMLLNKRDLSPAST